MTGLAFSSREAAEPGTAGRLFRAVDGLHGALLLGMLAAAPWLFGATEQWSIWTLNFTAYACGLLWAAKLGLRWRSGAAAAERIRRRGDAQREAGDWIIGAMGGLTAVVLLYGAVSALNARAVFYPLEHRMEALKFVPWLPATYDAKLSGQAFWNYLALALFFWGLRDWLAGSGARDAAEARAMLRLPARFRQLLWVISINATLLALAGIFQRLHGTDRLLWVRASYDNNPENMFGPFAFAGNAAQYLNLAWPLILGFWRGEREAARARVWDGVKVGGAPHTALLACAIITASAPLIAASGGGTLASLTLLGATLFVFLIDRRGTWRTRCTILLVCGSVLGLGGALGWDQLAPRLREVYRTPYASPTEVYANARQMALDYPLYGVGPGAFRTVYPLYRAEPEQSAHAFLHDDWLETRVTFGWAGTMLIFCLLGLALARWFAPGGIFAQWEVVAMLWVAVGGCLAHAKFSFPLQVYSILSLLLAELVILSSLSRPEK